VCARYQQRMQQVAPGPSTAGEQPVTGRHILWINHEQRRRGGDRWPRDLTVNRRVPPPRAPPSRGAVVKRVVVNRVVVKRVVVKRVVVKRVVVKRVVVKRAVVKRAVVNRDGLPVSARTSTAIRRQIQRTPQASSPPPAAAMKASWPQASPNGPRQIDRFRHETAWCLSPRRGWRRLGASLCGAARGAAWSLRSAALKGHKTFIFRGTASGARSYLRSFLRSGHALARKIFPGALQIA
jgi:hypothetical protein